MFITTVTAKVLQLFFFLKNGLSLIKSLDQIIIGENSLIMKTSRYGISVYKKVTENGTVFDTSFSVYSRVEASS